MGADASPARLELAYRSGIFPWPMEGLPLLWFSPNPRFVLRPKSVRVPRSLGRTLRRATYQIRADTAFADVIRGCAEADRPGQDGTWITDELAEGFTALHARGLAHSIEAWRGDELAGGLYGISLGGAFFGESMFARAEDASKAAFATLLGHAFGPWGFDFVDCQVRTDHLARFGAEEEPRAVFLESLDATLRRPTRRGEWRLELDASDVLANLKRAAGAG